MINPALNNPAGNDSLSSSNNIVANDHDHDHDRNNFDDKYLSSVQVAEESLSESRQSTPVNMASAVHDKPQLPEHEQAPLSRDESRTVRPDTENGSRTEAGDGGRDDGIGSQAGGEASQDRPPAEQLGKKKIIVIMIALCLALFLAALDMVFLMAPPPCRIRFGEMCVLTVDGIDDCVDGPADHGSVFQGQRKRLLVDGVVVSAGQRGVHSALGQTE